METKCHMCGNLTDYFCRDCGEPVCEDCCVPYDQFNLIDYTLCQSCYDGDMARRELEVYREEELEAEKRAKREARNKAARKRYWLPENVEKRRLAKVEKKRREAEQARKVLAETFRVMRDWTK